ncbi:MAG: hypothetical protein AUJ92_09405 [Armatimonadetes bacterium CG2_30_59_28]|nr:hypothetical protein [Armatimonadota bacterium]OIO94707.1 MAG: hypothetical protein AUJ92_09405 [Armatimonadetes bacterium CG2_30_59_28]PIU61602.1 MAG: hypothetical protein COS85_20705 [Armatimonadetes bacterium CG07_land_8_20_14_0_80_59_28]
MSDNNTLSYKNYLARVEFDGEGRAFYGRVINTRETITFQSGGAGSLRTLRVRGLCESAEEDFRQSVDTHLAFREELGESPDKPYSGKSSFSACLRERTRRSLLQRSGVHLRR